MNFGEVKDIKRGEVYYVRFDDNTGFEQAIGRPAIIISSSFGLMVNKSTALVVYCTSNTYHKGAHLVKLTTTDRVSMAKCNEIYTVDRRRIGDYMCTLNELEMKKVDEQILFCLGYESRDNDEKEETATENKLNEEVENVKCELNMYKKLYEKTLDRLCEIKIIRDMQTKLPAEKPKDFVENKLVPAIENKVNINTASVDEIREITGMGEQTAQEIVRHRRKNGPYKCINDLFYLTRFSNGCMKKYGGYLTV